MRTADRLRLKDRSDIVKAMAHPTRLCIVEMLRDGERTVGEMTRRVGDDISTVSRHLSVLRASGLVIDDKRGLRVFYRLATPCLLKMLDCVEAVLKARTERRRVPARR
jgi:ArsR family transcriptional regulator